MAVETLHLGDGGFILVARGVDPASVDFQPGDLSRRTALQRAASVRNAVARGERVPMPLVRARGNRYEVWDGNARVVAYGALGIPFDAVVVDELGLARRTRNTRTVPTDPDLWTATVARARTLSDQEDRPFRWPSETAREWAISRYLEGGGTFAAANPGRRRPAQEKAELKRYLELADAIAGARDLGGVARGIAEARTLRSPALVGTLERSGWDRAQRLGFACRGSRVRCLNELVEQYAVPQLRLRLSRQ